MRPVKALRYAMYRYTPSLPEWQDEAACQGLPTEYFELEEPAKAGSDMSDQHELIAKGLAVCAACPVRQACMSDSMPIDRYWTTRGGQPPEGLFLDSVMPATKLTQTTAPKGFAPGKGPRRPLKQVCKRGHEGKYELSGGKRRCMACRQEDNAKGWQKRAGDSLAS